MSYHWWWWFTLILHLEHNKQGLEIGSGALNGKMLDLGSLKISLGNFLGQEKNPKLPVSSYFHIYGLWDILG